MSQLERDERREGRKGEIKEGGKEARERGKGDLGRKNGKAERPLRLKMSENDFTNFTNFEVLSVKVH